MLEARISYVSILSYVSYLYQLNIKKAFKTTTYIYKELVKTVASFILIHCLADEAVEEFCDPDKGIDNTYCFHK